MSSSQAGTPPVPIQDRRSPNGTTSKPNVPPVPIQDRTAEISSEVGGPVPIEEITAFDTAQVVPFQESAAESDTAQVVTFLCQRFSGLIDRVQKAEASLNDDRQKSAGIETALRDVEERRLQKGCSEKGELSVEYDEVDKLKARLAEARKRAKEQAMEIQRAREDNDKLEQRCAELSAALESESQRAQGVIQLVNQDDIAYSTHKQECTRLQDAVHAMSVEHQALLANLSQLRERGTQHKTETKDFEIKHAGELRAREIAERKAQTQHEELCVALRKLALMKENLASVQTQLVHKERDLTACEQSIGVLRAENQQCQGELVAATKKLNCLCALEAQRERSIRENAEARSDLEAEVARRKQLRDKAAELHGQHEEASSKLRRTVESLLEVEGDVSKLQAQLNGVKDTIRQNATKIEDQEKERKIKASVHRNLQDESQTAFNDNESARREKEEVFAETDDLRGRMKQMAPKLESARRRWRELQESTEGLHQEVQAEKKARDSLEHSVSQLQQQLRTGRRRNLRLMEQIQDREEHLLRCFSYAVEHPRDLADAARIPAPRPLHTMDATPSSARKSVTRPPYVQDASPSIDRQGASPFDLDHALEYIRKDTDGSKSMQQGDGESTENVSAHLEGTLARWTPSKSLAYLKTWIEIEEARLATNPGTGTALTLTSGSPDPQGVDPKMLEKLLGDVAHSPGVRAPLEPSPGGWSSMASPDQIPSDRSYVIR